MPTAEKLKNGNTIQQLRQSTTTTGPHMYSQWKETTSDVDLLPQDGNNSSNGKVDSSETLENQRRLLKYNLVKILRTDKLSSLNSLVNLLKDG